jgi:hypothetical protein
MLNLNALWYITVKIQSVQLPLLQSDVIYCNFSVFSVAITDLSATTMIKFKFRTFYAVAFYSLMQIAN